MFVYSWNSTEYVCLQLKQYRICMFTAGTIQNMFVYSWNSTEYVCLQLKQYRICFFFTAGTVQNVFDRRAKLLQSERAAHNPDVDSFDFLKEEIGYR